MEFIMWSDTESRDTIDYLRLNGMEIIKTQIN